MNAALKYLAAAGLLSLLLPACYYGPAHGTRITGPAAGSHPLPPPDSVQTGSVRTGPFGPEGGDFNNQLEVQLDGRVVYDYNSHRMWQRGGSQNYMSFRRTTSYVDSLNRRSFAGFSDWRLPTLAEAMTILEKEKSATGLYVSPLFSARQYAVWTADYQSRNRVWVVYFSNGFSYYDHTEYGGSFVRAVR